MAWYFHFLRFAFAPEIDGKSPIRDSISTERRNEFQSHGVNELNDSGCADTTTCVIYYDFRDVVIKFS